MLEIAGSNCEAPKGHLADGALSCLLVEDSRFDRYHIRYAADRAGLNLAFTDAPTARAAIGHLGAGHFDIILLDHRLPDGSGLDLVPAIKASARNARSPAVLLSGFGTEELAEAAREAGCDDHLWKDRLTPESLGGLVRGLARRAQTREGAEGEGMDMRLAGARMLRAVWDLRRAQAEGDEVSARALTEEMGSIAGAMWRHLDGEVAESEGGEPELPF